MKRLMFMISTHGKSPGQATKEAWQAFQKYQKVEAQVLPKMSQQKPQEKPQPQSSSKEEIEEETFQAFMKLFESRNDPEKMKELQDELNNLNKPGMPIPPSQQDQYIKETFGLSDQELKQLDKGSPKSPLQPYKPQVQLSKKPLSNQELVQQANQELQTRGSTYDPSLKLPPGAMLVHFFRKTPKYPKNKLQKDIKTK